MFLDAVTVSFLPTFSPTMIADLPQWVVLSVVVVALLYKAKQSRSSSGKLPLPPSPPGYPIIGNLLDVPTRDMEPAFRDMNAKYGTVPSSLLQGLVDCSDLES